MRVQPEVTIHERRGDRRRSRRLVFHDRRSGFDRRRPGDSSWPVAVYESTLLYLRDHPPALASLLLAANLLSVLDLVLTLQLLSLGAREGNPVMDYLFDGSLLQAATVKCGIILAASLALWAMRRRRPALVTALFLLGLYGGVVLYEVTALLHLA